MNKYTENEFYKLYQGEMQEVLDKEIQDNSIDSIVTDPPYELNFMSKGWDNSGVSFRKDTWERCFKVLKPGGYLLAFGGSRTFHRIACAIEDAGFEIRDTIMWLYGSGFPKSMSLSKGLEAREKLGNAGTRNKRKIEQACDTEEYTLKQTNNGAMGEMIETNRKQYIPDTDLAKQWQGWGTALKPSYEPIIVARKPFTGSLVDNVMKYGVGGINIDECRVGNTNADIYDLEKRQVSKAIGSADDGHFLDQLHNQDAKHGVTEQGRFPANVILTYDDTDFDEVCGGMPYTQSSASGPNWEKSNCNSVVTFNLQRKSGIHFGDSGCASRYFYCAKASKKDRDEGLNEFANGNITDGRTAPSDRPYLRKETPRKNIHPTVKPTELMQYLIRLVTPKGGTILDPFNGSGSTGKATMYENIENYKNYKYIGIELTEEYLPISKARIDYVLSLKGIYTDELTNDNTNKEYERRERKAIQLSIFDLEELENDR